MGDGASSPIEIALRRLERAVVRLEEAAARAEQPDAELAAALAAARNDQAALEAVVRQVSGRLDSTIERLRAVLEE